jgi:hypothetical protein
MTAITKLLDKAKETCSVNSDAALAERMQVTRAQLSSWRVGREPMPEDRIAILARLAHADAGEWLILIEAEQARGEARKAYGSLIKRLGIAALLGLVCLPAMASHFAIIPSLSIMSTLIVMALAVRACQDWHASCPAGQYRHDYVLAL